MNAVEQWRAGRKRRRRSSIEALTPDRVLSPEELQRFLDHARVNHPQHYLLILLLADTGMRIGEAIALRWIDVDLERRTVRVARSYSTGRYLGPTKSGRERLVELTTRLHQLMQTARPNIFGDDALVCPGEGGGFLEVSVWRRRVFTKIARKVLGSSRTVTPHTLRHTYASIHISRGTNLLWVQRQGGWQSPTVLLSTYAHFLPTELTGFADVLAAPNGTIRHRSGEKASVVLA